MTLEELEKKMGEFIAEEIIKPLAPKPLTETREERMKREYAPVVGDRGRYDNRERQERSMRSPCKRSAEHNVRAEHRRVHVRRGGHGMTYAKHKTTQAEFVAAWWDKAEQKTAHSLEEHYPGVSSVKMFDGMTYTDKLQAIPNNALRRAGLKPIRRNGKRKKEQTVMSQASMNKILRNMNAMVTSIAALEIKKRTERFADFRDILKASNEVTVLEVRGGLGNNVQFTLTGEEAERYLREQSEQSAAMFKRVPFIIGCDLAQGESMTGRIEYRKRQEETE